ncbi:hypothetical protein Hanom_Chr04g00320501 [Helianthus anomalus]
MNILTNVKPYVTNFCFSKKNKKKCNIHVLKKKTKKKTPTTFLFKSSIFVCYMYFLTDVT